MKGTLTLAALGSPTKPVNKKVVKPPPKPKPGKKPGKPAMHPNELRDQKLSQQSRRRAKAFFMALPAVKKLLPLAIGEGNKIIRARPDDVGSGHLRKLLSLHVHRRQYHESVMRNTHRYSMDGEQADEISMKAKEYSSNALDKKAAMVKAS